MKICEYTDSLFGAELVEFCNLNKLDFNVKCLLPSSSFTYISHAHDTTSWIDHCITTAAGRAIISDAYIPDNVVCSDHFLLTVNVSSNKVDCG